MRTIEIKLYTIEDHPNKEKCFEWIRNNWLDLNQHSVEELITSIKALSNEIGGVFDYSISQFPDRGEFINFKYYDQEKLDTLIPEELPLTGVCWDHDLIEGLKEGNPGKALQSIHNETEYIYSNEGLFDLCMSMDYEFYENGECY